MRNVDMRGLLRRVFKSFEGGRGAIDCTKCCCDRIIIDIYLLHGQNGKKKLHIFSVGPSYSGLSLWHGWRLKKGVWSYMKTRLRIRAQ